MDEATRGERAETGAAGALRLGAVARLLAWIVLVALGYFAGGAFGRLLAIPPGYASALWVPAGLAFMAVLTGPRHVWIGVLLGSAAHNLIVSAGAGVPFAQSLAVSTAIGAGASLQAVVGARLVRASVGYPTALSRVGETLRFLLLGGPVACLLSATSGVSALALAGVVPGGARAFSWFNWWVGDTIGVLVVVPLWLVVAGEPRAYWRHRRLTVALPVIGLVAAALGAFAVAQHQEAARIRSEFVTQSADVARQIATELDETIVLLDALRSHFDVTPRTDRASFAALTHNIVARHGSLRAVEWVPSIAGHERAAFERAAAAEGFAHFTISDRVPGDGVRPSPPRAHYAPVQYIEPLDGNAQALGFDVSSEPGRSEAIEQSLSSGNAAITRPIPLLQLPPEQLGLLAFLPAGGVRGDRATPPRGFVVGVIDVKRLIETALDGVDARGVSFRLIDVAEQGPATVMYERAEGAGRSFEQELKAAAVGDFGTVERIRAPGRSWRIELHPTLSYLDRARTPMPWIVQTSGLGFAALIGVLLLNLSGRTEEVRREVLQRTRELEDRNRDLNREIAARERIEAARRASEERFAAAFEHSANGMAIEDRDGRIRRVNPALCTLLGYTSEELLTKSLYELTDPADLAASEAAARGLWTGRVARYQLEKRYLHKSGRPVWVVIACALIRDAENQPRDLVVQVQDITEFRAATQALAESEQKLRGLYETSRLGIALTDMDGRLLEFNAAFAELTGYGADELRALDYRTLTPQRYAADEARQLELLRTVGHYGPYEKEYVRKDGGHVPVQLRGMLLRTPAGAAQIWSIVEDISERKRLEAELASENARHQLFLRRASDGVCILDADARVVEVSDSLCAMLGYARDELLSMAPTLWDARLEAAEIAKVVARAFAGELHRFETLHRRKDGSTFEVEVTVDAFVADGRQHLYCSTRDITELRRLQRALLDVTAREQRKLGYDLHDELGQVLTGISMFAASLAASERAAGRPAADRLAELAGLARQAIGTCRAIAHGLSPLHFAAGGLVEALCELVRQQQQGFGAQIELHVVGAAPITLGPEALEHLYRIVQEAVTNARRHAHATLIAITLDAQPQEVRVEIEDDGGGFDRAGDSSGMGLRIMEFRAAMLGGTLTIEPRPTGGARVTCVCPQSAHPAA